MGSFLSSSYKMLPLLFVTARLSEVRAVSLTLQFLISSWPTLQPQYTSVYSCSLGGCSPPALLTPSLPQINAGDPQTSATSKHESRSRLAGQPSGLFAQAWIPLRGEEGSDCTPWPSPRAVPQEPGPMRTGRALLSSVASRAGTGSPDGS